MKINGITALQEDKAEDAYVMRFPADADVSPPFNVTTNAGEPVYVVSEYTKPVKKEIDLNTGETTITYGKPDERDLEIERLRALVAQYVPHEPTDAEEESAEESTEDTED